MTPFMEHAAKIGLHPYNGWMACDSISPALYNLRVELFTDDQVFWEYRLDSYHSFSFYTSLVEFYAATSDTVTTMLYAIKMAAERHCVLAQALEQFEDEQLIYIKQLIA